MKREELKVYYADLELQLYKSNPFPDHDDIETFIRKSEADAVMDAMEARIKELEEANKRTQKHREEVESSESNIRQEMFKMKARIKELEAEVIGYKASLERSNFKMCEKDARIKELEATISKMENNQKENGK